jgi:hypothetical protein
MGGLMEQYFNAAVKNVDRLGDTDIFPFPVENQLFHDNRPEVVEILLNLHKKFKESLHSLYPINQSMLTPVGYTGFRWATQIDPLWNAYLLGLVISIGDEVEGARISIERKIVFSYRFKRDKETGHIFNRAIG